MNQRKLSDTRDMGNVGLDSDGFPSDYDPKTVRGVPQTESSGEDGYPTQTDVNYEGQDEVREWDTQGEFGPSDELFEVFSEVMDAPAEELEEDHEVVTDGGVSYDDAEAYTDGGQPTMEDVDHQGPYGDEEGGAPW